MLFLSLYVCSRFHEMPMRADLSHGPIGLRMTFRAMRDILRADRRVVWLVVAHAVRSCGFLLGTYMTAVLIDRCNLTETQMWIPVLLIALPELVAHVISGLVVDRYGPKPALILSALLVAINSVQIIHCHTLPAFIFTFACIALGGSLLNNAWPTLIVKLAPTPRRPAYIATMSLATAPWAIAISLIGVALVHYTQFDYVFYVSTAGGFIAAILYAVTLPDIRRAPAD
jgi:predicted MFS family arabinose efflux permease